VPSSGTSSDRPVSPCRIAMPAPGRSLYTPSPDQTLGAIARRGAQRWPQRIALQFGQRGTTFAELEAHTERVALALSDLGLVAGDRVAVLAPDSDHVYELILGCAKIGVVSLGINWRLAPPEIDFILADSGAKVLFVAPGQRSKLDAQRLAGLRAEILMDPLDEANAPALANFIQWRDRASGPPPAHPADPNAVVVQMYTSGTTGMPKGVMLAQRSFFAIRRNLAAVQDPWIGWSPEDVSLLDIPAFHIAGVWWAMTSLDEGARLVILPQFAAKQVLETIASERVTQVFMVPAMLQMLLSEPSCRRTDFSSLKTIVYGGSPIPATLLQTSIETFRCGFAQIYGLTETGNTAVCLRPSDHQRLDGEHVLAAGRPYPGVEIRIVDPAGQALPARQVGEIWIHSPANMVGYWKRPEATQETLVDGWIRTGDAGFLDEQGYVFVNDRLKDMILYAGENVYPAEIESVLCAFPGVAEAAVIGIPDERWGERVLALVVEKPGEKVSKRELLIHARTHLADFKVPKEVQFRGPLPRTPSGKIKKAELRAPFWQGRQRQVN
jgi:acyl-CoA synthetase (AMP-forming)/AMP-acid ligase II